jgi:signal peptidase II
MLVLLLSFAITLIDQVTKYQVCLNFYPGEALPVIPGFLNLAYVRNPGAAWGMLGGLNGWLALFSIGILLGLIVFRRSFLSDILIHRLALGFMIGGIAGNLLDRLRLGYVVDFLDFYWATHHFPAFNVADAAICTGVGLYVLSTLVAPARSPGVTHGHGSESGKE